MKKIALFIALIMVLSFTSCAGKKAELNVSLGERGVVLDPAKNTSADGATLILHNFEGLYTLDKDGDLIPGQAKSYDISKDSLIYTFHLKDSLKWSDGKELTAEDFVYSWNRVVDKNTGSGYEYLFDVIKGYKDGKLDIKATDSKTLVVTLNAVTPWFIELTTNPVFMPVRKDVVSKNNWSQKAKTCIGNGPYKLTVLKGTYAMFERNKNYQNSKTIVSNSIKFTLGDKKAVNSYNKGNIQFVDNIPSDDVNTLKGNNEYHKMSLMGTYFLNFNSNKVPLNNPLVREALALAIDRDYIIDNFAKGAVPAYSFIPGGFLDLKSPNDFRTISKKDLKDYKSSFEEALSLLKEAGFPEGKGLPAIEYTYNDTPVNKEIATALKNMWNKIGVKVELTSQDWKSFLNTRKNGHFFIARNEFISDYNDPLTFFEKFTTGSIYNDSKFKDAEYDKLIKQAKTTPGKSDRSKIFDKAEEILLKKFALCPVYFYADDYLQNDSLQDVYVSPQGYKYFMYAGIE